MRKIYLFLGLAILGIGFYRILDRIWVTEDAYITFKHIENFFAGNGLSFNKTNRIESFTHPLWVFLLILGRIFTGLSTHTVSILLGILFSFSMLLYYFFDLTREKENLKIFLLPALYTIHQGFIDFSTSGLENSLTFFLLTLLLTKIWNKKIPNDFSVPTLLALLYFVRPEFALVLVYYSVIYAIENFYSENYLLKLFRFILIPAILVIGYHSFRYLYYHEIFPMSYHAKAGSGSDWNSGFIYLKHTLRYSPFLSQVLVIATIFSLYQLFVNKLFNFKILRDVIASIVAGYYILRMGGDFMAFRLLLPTIFILYFLIHKYIQTRFEFQNKTSILVNLLLLISLLYYTFTESKVPFEKWKIGDERSVYYKDLNQSFSSRLKEIKHSWYLEGLKFHRLQSCLGYEPFIVTNSVTNAKCAYGFGLGYFATASGTNVSVVDELGFTDKNVTLQDAKDRRPGHLKSIDLSYVIDTGNLFCSLNDERYDKIMKTHLGVLINLDPKLLYSLGKEEYSEIVEKLKTLYEDVSESDKPKDKELMSYLKLIEKKRKISILELPDQIPKKFIPEDDCWE
ncbi:MAG: hypothetical protein SFU98_18020 [Leptospiraceae bacterium]|nr:hypothetical protein [Leptospiraceae bacterium]